MMARPPDDVGASHEVELSAKPADIDPAGYLGVYLAGQIDFNRRVDGNEPIDRRHDAKAMRLRGRADGNRGIQVGEIVETPRPEKRSAHR